MRLVPAALALLAAAAFASPSPAQDAAPEHPVVKHYPGATVESGEVKAFDGADIVTGYNATPEPAVTVETVEGSISEYEYANDPKHSPLQVVRNYENALKASGFTTILVTKGDKVEIPNVGSSDVFGAFRLDKGGKPAIFMNVKASTDGAQTWSKVTVVEPKSMEQEYTAGSGEMYDSIAKSGRVAVYGINFDTGKATLQPVSDKVLGEVLKLLEEHPELKLRVEGHTDNVGAAASNKTLSEQRATAVKAWLVDKGVEARRLAAAGLGDTKPVAPNDAEEGRAKNRRVEFARME